MRSTLARTDAVGITMLAMCVVMLGCTDPRTPTSSDASQFVSRAEAQLEVVTELQDRAAFLNGTNETEDHTRLLEQATEIGTATRVALAKKATDYNGLKLPQDAERKLARVSRMILPATEDRNEELSEITSRIETNYTTAANCSNQPNCRPKAELYDVMSNSRDPQELLDAWKAWHGYCQLERIARSQGTSRR